MSTKLVTLSSNNTKDSQIHNFMVQFNSPLFVNEQWEMALTSCQMFYKMTNIDSAYGNNTFQYCQDVTAGSPTYKTLTLPNGLCTMTTLSYAITNLINADGGTGSNMFLTMNTTTFQCQITIAGNYGLELTTGGLRLIIGFNAEVLNTNKVWTCENVPDINRGMTSFNDCCDCISDSFNNNMRSLMTR